MAGRLLKLAAFDDGSRGKVPVSTALRPLAQARGVRRRLKG
jgi:hypothetical protein